jgi:hypothetical protein
MALRPEFPRRTPTDDLRVIISSRVMRRDCVPETLQQVDFVEKVVELSILQTQAFFRTPRSVLPARPFHV